MNLYQLQHFLYVAEEGSVTRGAERAAVSQPAVSRAIADLEDSLGERLFDRGPRGVTTTEAGRLLLDYAKRIFGLEREAEEALRDLRGLEAGRVAIGASTTIGDYLLPSAIATFVRAHPKVQITMEVGNTEAIQVGVLGGRYDVGLTEGDVDAGQFKVERLGEDALAVFASPSHALSHAGSASLEELSPYGFVMREEGSGTRSIVEANFAKVDFQAKIVCSLGSTTAIKRAVSEGIGLGIASVLTISEEIVRGELVVIETPLRISRAFHIVRLGWRRESAASRRFMQDLSARIAI
jgi:DNA-binding transcriptional LysR family regulator